MHPSSREPPTRSSSTSSRRWVSEHLRNVEKREIHSNFRLGLTIFRGIRAIDRDKPNTPNSDVQYAIVAGNELGKFALESSHQAFLILRKSLDFDNGDKEFLLTITASVSRASVIEYYL